MKKDSHTERAQTINKEPTLLFNSVVGPFERK